MLANVIRLLIILTFASGFLPVQAQFDPPAGQAGSRAIHADSNVFIGWATNCYVERGWVQAGSESLGKSSYGLDSDALGKADLSAVSLGDGGKATLTFDFALWNGPGPDFAIFENSFSDDFLELAFVEVSSDGLNFIRFNAQSRTQTDVQVDGFGLLDAVNLNNLAGKYRGKFGVPFDLDELKDDPNIDIQNVTHVRVVDVVGCLNPLLGSYDSEGRLINDPWPTPFPSSGFDLDAVGVIHDTRNLSVNALKHSAIRFFPQPANDALFIKVASEVLVNHINIKDIQGKLLFHGNLSSGDILSLTSFPAGPLILEVDAEGWMYQQIIIKR